MTFVYLTRGMSESIPRYRVCPALVLTDQSSMDILVCRLASGRTVTARAGDVVDAEEWRLLDECVTEVILDPQDYTPEQWREQMYGRARFIRRCSDGDSAVMYI